MWRTRLSPYKRVRRIEFAELPKTIVGQDPPRRTARPRERAGRKRASGRSGNSGSRISRRGRAPPSLGRWKAHCRSGTGPCERYLVETARRCGSGGRSPEVGAGSPPPARGYAARRRSGGREALARRRPKKPRPAEPASIMAQRDGSGIDAAPPLDMEATGDMTWSVGTAAVEPPFAGDWNWPKGCRQTRSSWEPGQHGRRQIIA